MQNKSKLFKNLLIIIIVFLIIGLFYVFSSNLNFTIEMYGNYSSSGADRIYSSKLTFIGNKLINGFQNYEVREGSTRICKENCNRITECIVERQQWVDKITGEKCTIDTFSAPLTKEGIAQQIKDGEILPAEDIYQCHYSTCYKIKEAGPAQTRQVWNKFFSYIL